MKKRALGKSGLEVSEIGFGAWAIGGSMWGGARDDDARQALRRAQELGVDFIDTALVYGDGHSERLVGQHLRETPGSPMVVATKVPPKTMRWPAGRGARLADVFPATWIVSCCERSLKNLGTERIDLLQLHVWEEPWTDEAEWAEAMATLRKQGKIRLAGVSLNSHEPRTGVRLVQAGLVDAVQVIYNVFDQSPEDELFPACVQHGVGVLARVPLDEGSLTGKLTLETTFPTGDFRRSYFGGQKLVETVRRVEALRPVLHGAGGAGGGSLAQSALRFGLSHPAVSTVIPGMRNVTQAEENCAASAGGPLPAETLTELRPHRWVREPY